MEKVNVPVKYMARLLRPNPTPILTSVGLDGEVDAAPFSAIMVACHENYKEVGPRVAVLINVARYTYKLVKETGEFVLNFPDVKLLKQLWLTARPRIQIPPNIKDKLEYAKLTPIPSEKVKAPRIKECKAYMECRVLPGTEIIIPDEVWGDWWLCLAEVVAISVDKDILTENWQFDVEKTKWPVHFGYNIFATCEGPIYAGPQREMTYEEVHKYCHTTKEELEEYWAKKKASSSR